MKSWENITKIYSNMAHDFTLFGPIKWNKNIASTVGILGDLAAPGRFYLVLLRSRPDTVHRFPPRKTQNTYSESDSNNFTLFLEKSQDTVYFLGGNAL